MSLHDRIMGQMPDDLTNEADEFYDGFAESSLKAVKLAKEADELMAEMARALAPYAELEEMEGEGANVAIRTLIKYNAWKEQSK